MQNMTLKTVLVSIAKSWNDITSENVRNTWGKLLKYQNLPENLDTNLRNCEFRDQIDQENVNQNEISRKEELRV